MKYLSKPIVAPSQCLVLHAQLPGCYLPRYYGNARSVCSLHEPVSNILCTHFDRVSSTSYRLSEYHVHVFQSYFLRRFQICIRFEVLMLCKTFIFTIRSKYFCTIYIHIYVFGLSKQVGQLVGPSLGFCAKLT